jgi:DNA-binding response OmpR family regulator
MSSRVLIVDDSQDFLDVASGLLEREGLAVVGVAVESEGLLGLVDRLRPDVVLVDITLADESGFDVARELCTNDDRSGSTVILISTRSETDLADLIADSPAAGFVPKAELSAERIRQLVESR